jgi:hypothetical protein
MQQANAACALSATAASVKIISCDIYAENAIWGRHSGNALRLDTKVAASLNGAG